MPTYDYRCEADGKLYEVQHPMAQSIRTWAELCKLANMELQDIPAETPVSKVPSIGGVVSNRSLKNPEVPPCQSGGGCMGGGCGF